MSVWRFIGGDMVDTSGGDFVSPGLRYFARGSAGAFAQVAAYLQDYESDLTVYWCGRVGRTDVLSLIDDAETALVKTGQKIIATFDAYGIESPNPDDAEQHIGPLSTRLAEILAPKSNLPIFDACRAELAVSHGKMIIWANVSGLGVGTLEEGGENIGVSIPQSLFENGAIREIIAHSISRTTELKPLYALKLVDQISTAIHRRMLTAG